MVRGENMAERVNDGALRGRIREGDSFSHIGGDPDRLAEFRRRFDLTASQLLGRAIAASRSRSFRRAAS
jgi:hypothetical protein